MANSKNQKRSREILARPPAAPPDAIPRAPQWALIGAGAAVIAAAVLAVYSNVYKAPFVFDDILGIVGNKTIRSLWPIWVPLNPPTGGLTVSGRPLLNLGFAVNYFFSKYNVGGYHATNVAIHIFAALALFGVIRRTLLRPVLRGRFGADALTLAFAVGLLWALHPLQTESVTYVIQRAESQVSLFYLLTLYCFIRSQDADAAAKYRVGIWLALAALCCWCGGASKEVMASAPLIVLVYDWTFCAADMREIWRRRRWFYLFLCAMWPFEYLLLHLTGERGGTAGFQSLTLGAAKGGWGEAVHNSFVYARIQVWAIVHYIRLAFWPQPLIFDYGVDQRVNGAFNVLKTLALGGGFGAALYGSWKKKPAGWAALAFFAILAPSSSIIPVASEAIAEHRFYLPLAFLFCPLILALHRHVGRWAIAVALVAAVAFGFAAHRRNLDYRSAEAIWRDTVDKRSYNARAQQNMGNALMDLGRMDEAIQRFRYAWSLNENNAEGASCFANALSQSGKYAESLEYFGKSLKLRPDDPLTNSNYGAALSILGRDAEAYPHVMLAAKADADEANYQYNAANVLAHLGKFDEAIEYFRRTLKINPNMPEAERNWGVVLYNQNKNAEALPHFERAFNLAPADASTENCLASVLARLGRFEEARRHCESMLRANPNDQTARDTLARIQAGVKMH